jgi:hypothetical protein
VGKLRVLIVSEGRVVDVEEFEDPRLGYVSEFNQLNRSTSFVAILPDYGEAARPNRRQRRECRPERHCGSSP